MVSLGERMVRLERDLPASERIAAWLAVAVSCDVESEGWTNAMIGLVMNVHVDETCETYPCRLP